MVYGMSPEVGCLIAKSLCPVNPGLTFMTLDDDAMEGILFKFDFVMVSLWRNQHFDPAVLAHAC